MAHYREAAEPPAGLGDDGDDGDGDDTRQRVDVCRDEVKRRKRKMQDRDIYKKLKAFVDAHDYSVTQIRDATSLQVQSLLGLSGGELTEYRQYEFAIKEKLIARKLAAEFDSKAVAAKAQIRDAILAVFPECVFVVDKINRTITLHLDGEVD